MDGLETPTAWRGLSERWLEGHKRKDGQIYLAGKASFTLKVAQGYKE